MMLQGTIIRGTTPRHEFELPYPLELVEDIRISYGQKKKAIFIKQMEECDIQEGIIAVTLTQEETLSFVPGKLVGIEIRIKLFDGQVVRSEEPICLRVLDTFDEEIME